jgi:hypothetical protein
MQRMRLFTTSLHRENKDLRLAIADCRVTINSLVAENINLTARNALLQLTLEERQRAVFAFPGTVKKKKRPSTTVKGKTSP